MENMKKEKQMNQKLMIELKEMKLILYENQSHLKRKHVRNLSTASSFMMTPRRMNSESPTFAEEMNERNNEEEEEDEEGGGMHNFLPRSFVLKNAPSVSFMNQGKQKREKKKQSQHQKSHRRLLKSKQSILKMRHLHSINSGLSTQSDLKFIDVLDQKECEINRQMNRNKEIEMEKESRQMLNMEEDGEEGEKGDEGKGRKGGRNRNGKLRVSIGQVQGGSNFNPISPIREQENEEEEEEAQEDDNDDNDNNDDSDESDEDDPVVSLFTALAIPVLSTKFTTSTASKHQSRNKAAERWRRTSIQMSTLFGSMIHLAKKEDKIDQKIPKIPKTETELSSINEQDNDPHHAFQLRNVPGTNNYVKFRTNNNSSNQINPTHQQLQQDIALLTQQVQFLTLQTTTLEKEKKQFLNQQSLHVETQEAHKLAHVKLLNENKQLSSQVLAIEIEFDATKANLLHLREVTSKTEINLKHMYERKLADYNENNENTKKMHDQEIQQEQQELQQEQQKELQKQELLRIQKHQQDLKEITLINAIERKKRMDTQQRQDNELSKLKLIIEKHGDLEQQLNDAKENENRIAMKYNLFHNGLKRKVEQLYNNFMQGLNEIQVESTSMESKWNDVLMQQHKNWEIKYQLLKKEFDDLKSCQRKNAMHLEEGDGVEDVGDVDGGEGVALKEEMVKTMMLKTMNHALKNQVQEHLGGVQEMQQRMTKSIHESLMCRDQNRLLTNENMHLKRKIVEVNDAGKGWKMDAPVSPIWLNKRKTREEAPPPPPPVHSAYSLSASSSLSPSSSLSSLATTFNRIHDQLAQALEVIWLCVGRENATDNALNASQIEFIMHEFQQVRNCSLKRRNVFIEGMKGMKRNPRNPKNVEMLKVIEEEEIDLNRAMEVVGVVANL